MKLSVFKMHRPAQGGYPGEPPIGPRGGPGTGMPAPGGFYPRSSGLRQRLLNRLLAATTGLTWLLYLLALPGWINEMGGNAVAGRSPANPLLPMVVYGIIAVGLSALTFAQRVSAADRAYPLRAGGFLILLIGAGAFMLASQGLTGNGRLLLALFPLLSVFLLSEGRFGRLVRFAALILSIFTVITIGFFAVQGYLLTRDTGAEAWLIAELGFGLIAIVSTLVFDAYLHDLESGMEKSQLFAINLERERQRLESQARQARIDLEYRLQQIHSTNEINLLIRGGGEQESGQAPSSAQPVDQKHITKQLLAQVCEQVKDRFGYDTVRVFLNEGISAETGANSPETAGPATELTLPILSGLNERGEPIMLGTILFQSKLKEAFSKDEVVLLESIAGSLASALENRRLLEQIESNLEEISALHRQYLRRAWMHVLDTRGPQEYQYLSIMHPGATPGRERPTGPIMMGPGSGGATPADRDNRPRSKNLLELPIQLRDQIIGSLVLEPEPGRTIGEQERVLIESVINQAALALENARLLDETRQRADQEMVTAGISTRIWSSTDIETILQTALHELGTSLNAAQGSIELWPEPAERANQDDAGDGGSEASP